MRERLKRWSLDPIVIPRGAMVAKYVSTALLGLAVAIATGPSLDEATTPSYSSWWGVGMLLVGMVATVGATRAKLWRVEFIGATGVVSLLAVYALSPVVLIFQGDTDRLAYSVIALGFMVFPTARLVSLIRKGGADE